uniref:Uncharacterized protein n=1 Tax=Romanomermis culicivorax TaxID=13658 RepID=A0A915IRR0_ROMCU
GFLVSVIYCFANSDVIEELKLWHSRRNLRQSIERSNDARRRSSSASHQKQNNRERRHFLSLLFTPASSWRRASCPTTTTTIDTIVAKNVLEHNE